MNSTKHRCRNRCWRRAPFFLIAILAKGAVVMLLWNALIPDVFHGPELNYLQALGLMILAKLLVGFGHHRHGPPWKHGRHFWNRMSVEEREALRERLRHRCGHHGHDHDHEHGPKES